MNKKDGKQIQWLFQFIKPHQIRWYSGYVFDVLGTGIFQICNGLALEYIGGGLIRTDREQVTVGIEIIILGAVIITVTSILFWICYGSSIATLQKNLKKFLFRKVLEKKYNFLEDSSAKMLTLLNQDIEMAAAILGEEFRTLIYGAGTSIIAVIAIIHTNVFVGMICLFTFFANIAVTLHYKEKQETAVRKRQNALEYLNETYKLLFDGASVLRSGNILEKPLIWVKESVKKVGDMKRNERLLIVRQNLFIQLFLNLNHVLPMTAGVYLCVKGQLEVEKVFFLVQMSIQFIFDYQLMGPALINISKAFASLHRLYEFSGEPEESEEYGTEKLNPEMEPALEFKEVEVKYHDHLALSIDNLTIPPNKLVAVVGESGAGKSTFIKMILQLIPWEGQFKLFGKDPKQYSLEELRGAFSYIEQNPQVFQTSILDNISYGNMEGNEEEIYQAACDAGIDDFEEKFTEGFHTLLGHKGVYLSGGECQRVAISRAILKDAPILVMDEATSALDVKSEFVIQQTIQRLRKDHTIIIAAHRINTIEAADYIIVLKKGKIVEFGSPQKLSADKGEYWTLKQQLI